MIYFYATRRFTFTVRRFVKKWAPHLADVMQLVHYDEIDPSVPLPPGAHILSDFERLLPSELRLVQQLHQRLSAEPDSYYVLNDPSIWSGRFGLLDVLATEGINKFKAYRLNDLDDVRYPAFLRWDNDHSGSIGDPVDTRAELDRTIKSVGVRRHLMRSQLMVTEQLDMHDDDGLCRKYSAFMMGDQLLPRNLTFSEGWLTKINYATVADHLVDEEKVFLAEFPHADVVRDVFAHAGLTYGRIDYGVHDGAVQVWEINTNPFLQRPPKEIPPQRKELETERSALMADMFADLAANAPTKESTTRAGLKERAAWRTQNVLSRRYNRFRR